MQAFLLNFRIEYALETRVNWSFAIDESRSLVAHRDGDLLAVFTSYWLKHVQLSGGVIHKHLKLLEQRHWLAEGWSCGLDSSGEHQ